jgi:hypothetical protein
MDTLPICAGASAGGSFVGGCVTVLPTDSETIVEFDQPDVGAGVFRVDMGVRHVLETQGKDQVRGPEPYR